MLRRAGAGRETATAPAPVTARRLGPVATLSVALVSVVALAAAVGAWRASRQAPLPPTLEGPCQVWASLVPSDTGQLSDTGKLSDTMVDPARSGGVYPVPAAARIDYQAVLAGVGDPGSRRLTGQVVLDLPPLVPDVTLARWDEIGSKVDNQGSRRYQLPPRWAPTGVTLRVLAAHEESGRRCRGALTIRLTGSALGSLLRPLAVGLLAASAWLVARASVPRTRRHDPWLGNHPDRGWASAAGRPGLGMLAGLVYGVFATVVLLLASAVALHSLWVIVLPPVGVATGLVIGWVGPRWFRSTPSPESPRPEPRELPFLEPHE